MGPMGPSEIERNGEDDMDAENTSTASTRVLLRRDFELYEWRHDKGHAYVWKVTSPAKISPGQGGK